MNKLTQIWSRAKARGWTHKGETLAHCSYLSIAASHGTGMYSIAAGAVVVFVVLGMLAGGEH